jgi:hypothetical protein
VLYRGIIAATSRIAFPDTRPSPLLVNPGITTDPSVDPVHLIIVYFQQEILCEAGPCLRNVSLLIYLLREGESEGPPQRPNYEARPLSENATTGRHGPAFEHGYGKAPSLTTRRSGTDSGVITQSTLVGIGSARLSQRAPPAQSSQLSPLAHSFVGLGPEIPQSAERTNLRNVSVDDQIPLGTTQSQTPVARGPNERSFYANQRGNLLRPASRRHDPDRHRSFRGPVETTEREGTQGGNKAVSGRGSAPGRAGSIHRPAPSDPTWGLPTLHDHRQSGSNRPEGNERSAKKLDERKFSASAWSYARTARMRK